MMMMMMMVMVMMMDDDIQLLMLGPQKILRICSTRAVGWLYGYLRAVS